MINEFISVFDYETVRSSIVVLMIVMVGALMWLLPLAFKCKGEVIKNSIYAVVLAFAITSTFGGVALLLTAFKVAVG